MSRRRDQDPPGSHARPVGTAGFLPRIAQTLAITLAASLGIAGCGRPDIVPVSGRITFEGRPVEQAVVRFQPEARPMAAASLDSDGRYRLTTRRPEDGAYFGRHRVLVAPLIPGAFSDAEAAAARARPDIPKVFRDAATTPLSVEVKRGVKNTFDFELSSAQGKSK